VEEGKNRRGPEGGGRFVGGVFILVKKKFKKKWTWYLGRGRVLKKKESLPLGEGPLGRRMVWIGSRRGGDVGRGSLGYCGGERLLRC